MFNSIRPENGREGNEWIYCGAGITIDVSFYEVTVLLYIVVHIVSWES